MELANIQLAFAELEANDLILDSTVEQTNRWMLVLRVTIVLLLVLDLVLLIRK